MMFWKKKTESLVVQVEITPDRKVSVTSNFPALSADPEKKTALALSFALCYFSLCTGEYAALIRQSIINSPSCKDEGFKNDIVQLVNNGLEAFMEMNGNGQGGDMSGLVPHPADVFRNFDEVE